MHDYLLSSEWVRFAFVLGVAVSMLLYERRHLTTGSIVVPGYIAVFMIHPLVIIATFANALFTYWLVNHVLRRFFLLYGRTKFTILAACSTIIQTLMLRITPRGQWLWESDIPLVIGVGYVVPALIAHDMARQGVWKTTRSVLLAGFIVATPIFVALLFDLPGVNDLAPLDGFGNMAIEGRWLPLAVLLSVLASWAVAMNYGLRSGGFIGAAFVSMFMGDPWQVAAAIATAALTYLFVTRVLMNSMILFGRRKFSSMLLVSSAISWVWLWVGLRFFGADWHEHLGVGSLALTPLLLPGLLANDAQRTSPKRVVHGVLLGGAFVLTTTWWVQSVVTGALLHPGWKLLSLLTFGVVFRPQVTAAIAWLAARTRHAELADVRPAPEVVAPEPVAATAGADPVAEPVATPDPAQVPDPEPVAVATPEPAQVPDPVLDPVTVTDPVAVPDPVPTVAMEAEPDPIAPEPVAPEPFVAEPLVLEPAVPEPATLAPAAAADRVMPWREWARTHRSAADDAEAWLESQLAGARRSARVPVLAGAASYDPPHDPPHDVPDAPPIDDLTVSVLGTALAGSRGVAPVPRRSRRNPLATNLPVRRSTPIVPATSRDARPAAVEPVDPTPNRTTERAAGRENERETDRGPSPTAP